MCVGLVGIPRLICKGTAASPVDPKEVSMNGLGKSSFPARSWLCAALLLTAVAISSGRLAGKGKWAAAAPKLAAWDIPRLVRYLEGQDPTLRPVASARGLGSDRNVYFTRTDLDFTRLDILLKSPERIESWRGTVYCERMEQPESREIQANLWGDCCLLWGPFVFFGDPELLAEIRGCLNRAQGPADAATCHCVAE
jgi:hypothetical protein